MRKGNPKNIKDWDDLCGDDVKIVFPNPKTSGNARYTYLAAVAFANEKFNGDQAKVDEFIKKIFANVPVFDTRRPGRNDDLRRARNRRRADYVRSRNARIAKQYGTDKFEVLFRLSVSYPNFPVAIVDKVVDKRGSRELAKNYLDFRIARKVRECCRVRSPRS